MIDVGAIEGGGWAVVEAHPAWASGCATPIRRRCSRCCAAAWCRAGQGGGCGRARS
ncbi:hypothetical protein [Nannocystis radixulma]|uniref:hypothetical protein n=1 Tax=Nannocystis radixulma TaxID=2995305 RepID=UPI00358DC915